MPVQLITPLWGPLATQQAAQGLSDSNTDFLVVGVCSSEAHTVPLLVQGLAGKPSTCSNADQLPGLQMHVSRERIITLDASGMLSSAVLSSLLSSNRPQPAVGSSAAAAVRAAARKAGGSSSTVPVEGVAMLLTLQLLVFLCAVCNVVVISMDFVDLQLLQLLEAAGTIVATLPSITTQPQQPQQQQQQQQQQGATTDRPGERQSGRGRSSRHQQQQQQSRTAAPTAAAEPVSHVADLVLLQCCKPLSGAHMQQLQGMVDTCLASTAWHSRQQIQLQSPAAAAAAAAVAVNPSQQQAQQQGQASSSSSSHSCVSIWTVPPSPQPPPPPPAPAVVTSARVPTELQQLLNKLLHYPRTTSSSNSQSGIFSRSTTEGEWLRAAERVWDDVQDSAALLQYYRAVAETRLVGAGGWGSAV